MDGIRERQINGSEEGPSDVNCPHNSIHWYQIQLNAHIWDYAPHLPLSLRFAIFADIFSSFLVLNLSISESRTDQLYQLSKNAFSNKIFLPKFSPKKYLWEKWKANRFLVELNEEKEVLASQ